MWSSLCIGIEAMIRKKYVIIFMVIYIIMTLSFFATASLLSPFISRLAPAAALATGTGGGFTIPAKIIATTSAGAKVASWISLAVPGVTGAKVAIALTGIAGALAADYIFEKGKPWFEGNGFKQDANGNWTQNINQPIPDGYTAADFNGVNCGNFWISGYTSVCEGVYADKNTALAARNAKAAECGGQSGNIPYSKGTKGFYTYCPEHMAHGYFYPHEAATHNEPVPAPSSPVNVENKLASDLAAEDANAKEVVKAGLDVAAASMDDKNHPVSKNTTTYNNVNNYLINNMTNNQATNLEASATPNVGDNVLPDDDSEKLERLTPAQIAAAVAAALANQGLSASQIAAAIAAAQSAASGGLTAAELTSTLSANGLTAAQIAAAIAAANPAISQTQVKTAVKEAIDDETGITAPVDPTILLPDKLSLTKIMNDFWTSVQALPIFNVLNGITITTSGSSNLCIDLSAAYGGQRCYNGSNVQDELNMIGSVILGLTTVVSFVGIFKG